MVEVSSVALNSALRNPITRLVAFAALTIFVAWTASAGDDSTGTIPYRLNLREEFDTYPIQAKDEQWAQALAAKFGYRGKIVFFGQTTLPLTANGATLQGYVYRRLDKPEFFYVLNADVMLEVGTEHPYNPGVGGFSIHAPRSRKFLACLNCQEAGVPVLTSSAVTMGEVSWYGHDDRPRL
jgi:hypothetical protein